MPVESKAPYAECSSCPLRNRPIVPGCGPGPEEAGVVIVGEAPGRNEARFGYPFIGDSGYLLRKMMQHVGFRVEAIDDLQMYALDRMPREGAEWVNGEVYFTNCCLCQPPGNKIPPRAAQCCSKRLAHELKPYWDAGVPIGALGVTASNVIIGRSSKSLRGQWYKDGRIVATWHPAYVLRVSDSMQGRFSELMHDLRKLRRGRPMELPEPEYVIAESPEHLDDLIDLALEEVGPKGVICYDLETDQLMWWKHKIICGAFAWAENKAFVIPEELVYLDSTRQSLNRFFGSDAWFVGHNIKFDVRYVFRQLGVTVMPRMEDTLIAHHVLDENMRHSLKPMLSDYMDVGDYEGQLIHAHLRTKGDYYSKIPRNYLYHYNVLDVCYTLMLWHILEKDMREEGMYSMPYRYPMMASQPMLIDMELHGMWVDADQLAWLQDELARGIEAMQMELEEACGSTFNANSWVQVGRIMYDVFKMPIVRGRGFKARSTCQQARRLILQEIDHDSDAAQWLIKFDALKSLLKLKTSYVDNVWRFLDDMQPVDPNHLRYDPQARHTEETNLVSGGMAKVHPDGLIFGTESGRMSFRDPPIQTIPRPGTGSAFGDVWGAHIRGYYKAPPGYKIVEVDISQAEMRVACALSGEPFLHRIYDEGSDLHTMVALEMYGENYTKDQRNACKKFNFAYLYGGTEHSFALEEGMDIRIARDFVRRYQAVMPVLTKWKEQMLDELIHDGYVQTRTGRRRRFPIITNDNRDSARKAAVNMPVQGMASEITLITAIKVWEYLKEVGYWGDKATLISIIHDSVLMEVRNDHVAEVAYHVQSLMRSVGDEWVPEVPWKVDIDIGEDWGHLEDISKWPEYVRSAEKV